MARAGTHLRIDMEDTAAVRELGAAVGRVGFHRLPEHLRRRLAQIQTGAVSAVVLARRDGDTMTFRPSPDLLALLASVRAYEGNRTP